MNRILLTLFASALLFCANAQVCTPPTPVGSPGLSPTYDNFACVVQGVNFNEVIQFENFSTITVGGNTIQLDSMRVDSISNLPCNLSYRFDRPSPPVYTSGETGCILVFGNSTDAVGQYKIGIWVTAWIPGFPPVSTEVGSIDPSFQYFVRVKSTAVANCPPVNVNDPGETRCQGVAQPLAANIMSDNMNPCPGDSIILSSNATGGSGSYTFAWSAGVELPTTGVTPAVINGPTTYSVTVSDNFGTVADTITITTSELTVDAGTDAFICGGNSTTVETTTTGNTDGVTYLWSNGSMDSLLTTDIAGTYFVTATNQYGCSDTDNVTLTNVSTNQAVSFTAPDTACIDEQINLINTSANTTGWSWNWDLGNGQSATSQDAQATYLQPGSQTVTLTADSSGCTLSVSDSIYVKSPAEPFSFNGVDSDCAGIAENTFTAVLGSNLGTSPSYQWFVNGNLTGSDNDSLVTGMLNPGDEVWCLITSSESCVSPQTISTDTITMRNCTGIEEWLDISQHVSLYPNPGNGTFILTANSDQPEDWQVSIHTLTGKQVWSRTYQGISVLNTTVNAQNLAAGIYLLHTQTEKGMASKKVIIQ